MLECVRFLSALFWRFVWFCSVFCIVLDCAVPDCAVLDCVILDCVVLVRARSLGMKMITAVFSSSTFSPTCAHSYCGIFIRQTLQDNRQTDKYQNYTRNEKEFESLSFPRKKTTGRGRDSFVSLPTTPPDTSAPCESGRSRSTWTSPRVTSGGSLAQPRGPGWGKTWDRTWGRKRIPWVLRPSGVWHR